MNSPVSSPPASTSATQAAGNLPTPKPIPDTIEIAPPPLSFGAPAEGRIIEGVLTGKASADQYLLQTDSGALALQTASGLQIGAPLTLQIVSSGAPILAMIIAKPPTNEPSATVTTQTTATPPNMASVATTLSRTASTVASPTVMATVTGAPIASLSTSTAGVANPEPILAPASLNALPRTQSGTGKSTPTITAPNIKPPSALAIGSRARLNLLAARPAGQTTPLNATNLVQGSTSPFNAVIITAANAGGLARADSPLGELTFITNTPLPLGANLVLQVTGAIETPAFEPISPQALAFAPHWKTLQSLLSASPMNNVANPRGAIENAVPQPNAQLTASAMFFMSALRMGDLRHWLGADAMSVLEQSGLLGQMTDEFGAMGTLATETAGSDWRLFLIPLLSGGLLQYLKLFIHGNDGDTEDDPDATAQRFVIEVEFKKLGAFQFEGLARPKQFDLTIRTARNIPVALQDGIVDVFTNTVTALGLTGGLKFKLEEPFLTQPMQSAHSTGPDILI